MTKKNKLNKKDEKVKNDEEEKRRGKKMIK